MRVAIEKGSKVKRKDAKTQRAAEKINSAFWLPALLCV